MQSVRIDETSDTRCCIDEDTVTYDKNSAKIMTKSDILRNKGVSRCYRYIFKECDTDEDGFISTVELKQFLVTHEGNIPDRVVECLYKKFDLDKDQQLSFDEFLDLIIHPTVTQALKMIANRYLKFVAGSTAQRTLTRTVTGTGKYGEQFKFNLCTISIILLSIVQIMCYYIDKYECDHCIRNATEFDLGNSNHIYGNVVVQIVLGVPLEMVHTWRVPLIYVAGAVGGCLLHSVADQRLALVGGSPGLYSFYSAYVATVILNWREMSHPAVHLIIFMVLIVFDAIRNFFDPIDERTSYSSHLGGVVVGLLMGVIVLRNLKITRKESIIWYICLGIFCVLSTAFAIWTALIDLI